MLVEAEVIQVAANSSSERMARVKGIITNYHTGTFNMTVFEGENATAFETYIVGTSGLAAGTFTMKYQPQAGYLQNVLCRLNLKIFIGGFTSSLGSLTRTDAGSNSALTAPTLNSAPKIFGGNVGIGTTYPSAPVEIASTRNTEGWSSGNSMFNVLHNNGSGAYYGLSFGVSANHGDGVIQTFNKSSGAQYDLRLQPSGGNVGIGTKQPVGKLHINTASLGEIIVGELGSSQATAPVCIRDYGNQQIHFYYSTSKVGSITSGSTSTSYNTSSDYRIKENVIPLVSALERVNDLDVYRFNFITDTEKTVDGFFAHEVQSVVPEAITGVKDETEDIGVITNIEDGKTIKSDVTEPTKLKEGTEWTYTGSRPVYQSIDQSKLVPLLTKAIQELKLKNDALEARIAALENA
jgi:hypothetical protein